MKLYQIVVKDVMRRKRRMLYAMLGIVIGTMTVVGILTIARAGEARIYDQLEKYGPNLTVVPAINNLDVKLGDLSLGSLSVGENYFPESRLPEIRQIADGMIKEALNITDEGNIATLAPKLYVNTTVKGASLIAVGIDPAEERAIKTWWQVEQGEYLDGGDQALVGALAAHLLQISPGDKLTLKNREVTVAGVLEETGSGDDYQIFVPLATLQGAFGKEGQISSLDIRALCNACPVSYIAEAINGTIPGVRAVAVKQVAETEMGMVLKMKNFMLALAGITLLVGLFAVVNTMLASVHERIKDIGIMKAIGASRNQIVRIFIYEAIIIGLAGGVLGYLIGGGLAYLVGPLLFDGVSITYVPQYLPLALVVAALTAVTATVYPALRATRVKVAESLRSI